MSEDDALNSPPRATELSDDGEGQGLLGGEREQLDEIDGVDEDLTREALRMEVERLRERTERLQNTYARAKKAEYQRAAAGLGTLGVIAIAAAVVLPNVQTLLVSLGAIGLFSAVLTYYLTPEQFIAADIGTGVYRAHSEDRAALIETLGLSDHRVYVPLDTGQTQVRLFVPQFQDYTVPGVDSLASPLVAPADDSGQGVTFTPSGRDLYESFRDVASGDPTDDVETLTVELCDTLVSQFALIDAVSVDYDTAESRVTVAVEGAAFGPVERIDHPVVSVLAVAVATATRDPVTVEVAGTQRDSADYLLTYRWDDEEADA